MKIWNSTIKTEMKPGRVGAGMAAILLFIFAGLILAPVAWTGGDAMTASRPSSAGAGSGEENRMEKATFGAGCFWGVEDAFMKIEGVASTRVGYSGGTTDNPTYQDVCGKGTGHAEAVEITFDPSRVSYDQLLDLFWKIHDPTQVDRQGPDVGSQYRTVIFFHSPAQKEAAEASKAKLEASGEFRRPIATQIVPAVPFHEAEEYHQQYFAKRGGGSCHVPR